MGGQVVFQQIPEPAETGRQQLKSRVNSLVNRLSCVPPGVPATPPPGGASLQSAPHNPHPSSFLLNWPPGPSHQEAEPSSCPKPPSQLKVSGEQGWATVRGLRNHWRPHPAISPC